jgi:serine/threonine protein kinase
LIQTKSDIGPVCWMAPESIATRTYSKKTDVWTFGIVGLSILSSLKFIILNFQIHNSQFMTVWIVSTFFSFFHLLFLLIFIFVNNIVIFLCVNEWLNWCLVYEIVAQCEPHKGVANLVELAISIRWVIENKSNQSNVSFDEF